MDVHPDRWCVIPGSVRVAIYRRNRQLSNVLTDYAFIEQAAPFRVTSIWFSFQQEGAQKRAHHLLMEEDCLWK